MPSDDPVAGPSAVTGWYRASYPATSSVLRSLWRVAHVHQGSLSTGQANGYRSAIGFAVKYELDAGLVPDLRCYRDEWLTSVWLATVPALSAPSARLGRLADFLDDRYPELVHARYGDAVARQANLLLVDAASGLQAVADDCATALLEARAPRPEPSESST